MEEDIGAALALRWKEGADREDAFRKLYGYYYPMILGFFVRRGFSPEESRDLTQEAFLQIAKSLDGFRHDSNFTRWLFETTLKRFDFLKVSSRLYAYARASFDATLVPCLGCSTT